MNIEHLDHLVLTVNDVGVACSFYERVLGMKTVSSCCGRRALVFGSQKINLHQQGEDAALSPRTPTPGSGDLCFITSTPLVDVVAHLNSCGVPIIEGPIERAGAMGLIMSVYFRDPDGNLVEVSNYKSPT
jgi:catechol 2,3-dioxygenase-like lactoylglutathione lyase family enzyme